MRPSIKSLIVASVWSAGAGGGGVYAGGVVVQALMPSAVMKVPRQTA
jgi:hypothetical protein